MQANDLNHHSKRIAKYYNSVTFFVWLCEIQNCLYIRFSFLQEVQILKALILGEEERGQSQYQVVCFIFRFPKDSFISSDAMSKLRQKNPTTIRTPEEDKGRFNYTMDYTVDIANSAIISPHIAETCNEASSSTYTRHEDVVVWSTIQGMTIYFSFSRRV